MQGAMVAAGQERFSPGDDGDDRVELNLRYGGRRSGQEGISRGLNAFRIFMNVVFRTGLILVMHVLGWLTLQPVVLSWALGGVAVTALILAAIFALLFELIFRVYVLSTLVSCGATMLVVPVFMVLMGFLTLRATLEFASQFVAAPDDGWFVVLVLGTMIWFAAVPRYMLRKRPVTRTDNVD
jgi:hypothetical protein